MDFRSALETAKNNPGSAVKRRQDGNGFDVIHIDGTILDYKDDDGVPSGPGCDTAINDQCSPYEGNRIDRLKSRVSELEDQVAELHQQLQSAVEKADSVQEQLRIQISLLEAVGADALLKRIPPERLRELDSSILLEEIADQLSSSKQLDIELVTHMFEKACQLGSGAAAYRLGLAFEYGIGVEQSHATAYQYYSLAARRGESGAHLKADSVKPPSGISPGTGTGNYRAPTSENSACDWSERLDDMGAECWERILSGPDY
jgi:hypothetical protein